MTTTMTGAQLLAALQQLPREDLARPVLLAVDDFGETLFPVAEIDTAHVEPTDEPHLPERWSTVLRTTDPDISPEAPEVIVLWPQIGPTDPTIQALVDLDNRVDAARTPVDDPDAQDLLLERVIRSRRAFARAIAPIYR
jgi:hypothetical protein